MRIVNEKMKSSYDNVKEIKPKENQNEKEEINPQDNI